MSTDNPAPENAEPATQTTTSEVSFVDQLVEATGSKDAKKVRGWLEKLVQDAEKDQFRIERKTLDAIDKRVKELDAKLSQEVAKVLHHPKFQKLEGSWRGLKSLVDDSLLGSDLRIQVFDLSKDELCDDMEAPSFQSTVLYDKIYTRRYNMLGGVPIGTIVGDFEFSNAARDVKTLSIMSEICAVSHAPFLTSPSPKLFGIPEGKGWEVLEDLDDTAIENRFLNVSVVEMTEWRAFREKPDSRYVSMCMPKALARLPYGMGDCEDPNGGQGAFEFQELPIGKDGVPIETGVDRYCWKNAAFCMAQCMSDAFAYHGWAVAIRGLESGGKVEGLPIHYFASEENPDVRVQCPTQVPLAMSKDAILGKVGFLPLLYELNSAHAVFIGGQTVHKPKAFDDSEAGNWASANENLSSRLPFVMAVSRAAHAIQPMLRVQLGKSKEASEIEDYIHNWFVNNYVLDMDGASEARKAEKPFRSAQIKVEEDPASPGVYNVKCSLRPHFQVEEINMQMSLVASQRDS